MKDETVKKVEQEVASCEYLSTLPDESFGFKLSREMKIEGDRYYIFSYDNDEAHRWITAYYHDETKEYKIREKVGLVEFCRIECIAEGIVKFEEALREHLANIVSELGHFDIANLGELVREKNIVAWDYKKLVPDTLLGFELFIRPTEPVRMTNGSYIIIDYEDFANESDFTIYYNIFRDEFFGESRIRKVPDITYDFDSRSLDELEAKLKTLMPVHLNKIRRCLAKEEEKK